MKKHILNIIYVALLIFLIQVCILTKNTTIHAETYICGNLPLNSGYGYTCGNKPLNSNLTYDCQNSPLNSGLVYDCNNSPINAGGKVCTTYSGSICNICYNNYYSSSCPHYAGTVYGGIICSPYSVDVTVCNICYNNYYSSSCPHYAGTTYNGILCSPFNTIYIMCNICNERYLSSSCPHYSGEVYGGTVCSPYTGTICSICNENYYGSCIHISGRRYGDYYHEHNSSCAYHYTTHTHSATCPSHYTTHTHTTSCPKGYTTHTHTSACIGSVNDKFLGLPVSSPINAGHLYGEKLSSNSAYGHMGIDFAAPTGTDVYSAYGGKVVKKRDLGNSSYGKFFAIESTHPQDPNTKFYHYYCHLSEQSSSIEEGDIISQGQYLGKSGATGNVTGSHLHFEIRMGEDDWYKQRNPEILLARSAADGYGTLRGKVLTSSGTYARYKRISGATKGTDTNYGSSYSYYVMENGEPFPDEAVYGINYYIARINTGNIILNFDNGAITKSVTVSSNTDSTVSDTTLP